MSAEHDFNQADLDAFLAEISRLGMSAECEDFRDRTMADVLQLRGLVSVDGDHVQLTEAGADYLDRPAAGLLAQLDLLGGHAEYDVDEEPALLAMAARGLVRVDRLRQTVSVV